MLAKRLVGSNKNLLKTLRQQILDYDRYESKETKVIGYSGYPNTDVVVADKMTYSQWIEQHHRFPVIKLEGLEKVLDINSDSIHLFYHQRSSYSFKWHKDNVNVFLYVVKGIKKVAVRNRKITLYAGQGVFIPRGHLHRVFSRKDTWALSIAV